MHEVDSSTLIRALAKNRGRIVVDKREAVLAEAGEFIHAGIQADQLVELGELVRDGIGEDRGDITIFKSVGVRIQDVGIAKLVVERAETMGIGKWVEGYDVDSGGIRSKL